MEAKNVKKMRKHQTMGGDEEQMAKAAVLSEELRNYPCNGKHKQGSDNRACCASL